MSVTVITPSLPSRSSLRSLAMHSVGQQERVPEAHLVGIDYERRGTAAVRNALARASETEWLAPLDDDDIAYPNHISSLLADASDADVVYSFCAVTGRDWNPSSPFDAERLRSENYIPVTSLIRHSLWAALGGWRNSSEVEHGWEDWDFWLRALGAGARFRCVPEVTWEYRFGSWNKTLLGERAAR